MKTEPGTFMLSTRKTSMVLDRINGDRTLGITISIAITKRPKQVNCELVREEF